MPELHQFKGLLRKFRRKEKDEAGTVTPVSKRTMTTTSPQTTAQDDSSSASGGETPASTAGQVQFGERLSAVETNLTKEFAIGPTAKAAPRLVVSKGMKIRRSL